MPIVDEYIAQSVVCLEAAFNGEVQATDDFAVSQHSRRIFVDVFTQLLWTGVPAAESGGARSQVNVAVFQDWPWARHAHPVRVCLGRLCVDVPRVGAHVSTGPFARRLDCCEHPVAKIASAWCARAFLELKARLLIRAWPSPSYCKAASAHRTPTAVLRLSPARARVWLRRTGRFPCCTAASSARTCTSSLHLIAWCRTHARRSGPRPRRRSRRGRRRARRSMRQRLRHGQHRRRLAAEPPTSARRKHAQRRHSRVAAHLPPRRLASRRTSRECDGWGRARLPARMRRATRSLRQRRRRVAISPTTCWATSRCPPRAVCSQHGRCLTTRRRPRPPPVRARPRARLRLGPRRWCCRTARPRATRSAAEARTAARCGEATGVWMTSPSATSPPCPPREARVRAAARARPRWERRSALQSRRSRPSAHHTRSAHRQRTALAHPSIISRMAPRWRCSHRAQ